jgi:hypothetical protein
MATPIGKGTGYLAGVLLCLFAIELFLLANSMSLHKESFGVLALLAWPLALLSLLAGALIAFRKGVFFAVAMLLAEIILSVVGIYRLIQLSRQIAAVGAGLSGTIDDLSIFISFLLVQSALSAFAIYLLLRSSINLAQDTPLDRIPDKE